MYKHLDKCIKKRHVYILIILQKVCQNVKLLEMREKQILGVQDFVRIRTFCVRNRTVNTTQMLKSDFLGKCMF